MIQIDGSRHDWLMNGRKITLHGAIDDATYKVVALYFCENECLLGYYQLLWQVFNRTGGMLPRAIYSDRSSCFFVNRGATLEEQLAGAEKSETQWQKTCRELGIELIAAYSPQDSALHWKAPPHCADFDFLFSVRTEKKTRASGSFVYHGYKFNLLSARSSCVRFTLCLSENYGLRAYRNGRYYNVELAEPMCDCVGDPMPAVEKDLIYRYFYADRHSGRATIRAG